MARSRVACVRVPDLPLAAALRARPELRGTPLAIAAGPGPRAELVTVSPEAARAGVRRGASVAHARSVCPALGVRVASPALEQAARDALLDAAFACAPRAALAPRAGGAFATEAAVFADATGTTALFHSERGFASALGRRAQTLGLGDVRVAVASSGAVARLVARHPEGAAEGAGEDAEDEMGSRGSARVDVLAPDREAAFLAPLPLDWLDPEDDLAGALTRFGVRRVRDLLALPRRGLRSRLGPRALDLVQLARGRARETPLAEPRSRALGEGVDLEVPVDRLEPLLFVLRGTLSRLLERLAARHRVCGDLELVLALEGGGRDARRVGVAAPTGDLRVLLRLLQHALGSQPPQAPVESARLETEGRAARGDQLDLFRPAGPAPAVLGETLAALQSLCGAGRVGAPVDADTHHPDAWALSPFAPPAARDVPARGTGTGDGAASSDVSGGRSFAAALALRALRPPVSARVRVHGHTPVWVRSPVANGRVVRCAGPWRTTGGWWSPEERFAFDSFDVQTEDGIVARLRFDHVARTWQIDSVYD